VQEEVKKVPTMGGYPILIVTQTPVTRYVREDPVAIASIGSNFMTTI
jgi:hypothetical protein